MGFRYSQHTHSRTARFNILSRLHDIDIPPAIFRERRRTRALSLCSPRDSLVTGYSCSRNMSVSLRSRDVYLYRHTLLSPPPPHSEIDSPAYLFPLIARYTSIGYRESVILTEPSIH